MFSDHGEDDLMIKLIDGASGLWSSEIIQGGDKRFLHYKQAN